MNGWGPLRLGKYSKLRRWGEALAAVGVGFGTFPQQLKPRVVKVNFMARLKPCPSRDRSDWVAALEAELFHFVVVVLAVEDVPFLGALGDDAALGGDFLAGSGVDLDLFEEKLGKGLAGFLADGVSVLEEVDFVDFGEGIGDGVGELVELVVGDASGVAGLDVGSSAHGTHRTALYLRASSCLTFLNISG